jgi:tetratricopeptide (TPR) repeat protein
MTETRFASVLALVRVLAGAEPITRQHAALTSALDRLKTATKPAEIERLDRMIWRMWSSAGTRESVAALQRALQALSLDQFGVALAALDDAINADLAFAEAWNRRATVYFLLGERRKAVSDIERVLVLEPRHYGALAGLGQLLAQEGEPDGALSAFEAALEINPHLVSVRHAAERLRAALPDTGIRRTMLH